MALVTYILLSGIVAGSQSRFHPELLGVTATKSLGTPQAVSRELAQSG
jgi:hypothetical protein